MIKIGDRLKSARESIGYTLDKVQKISDIGISSLCEFENGKREPKFSQLSLLAELYKKPIEFFFSESVISETTMLWREKPKSTEPAKATETDFLQLCEQYNKLEILMEEKKDIYLPQSEKINREEYTEKDAKILAWKVQKEFCLGDIPSQSLKKILEEKYYIKLFHLEFEGSAICFRSDKFGYAVLLNSKNKEWRRNFDLAHELFHLMTWEIFRTSNSPDNVPSEKEEVFANIFASSLLLPTDETKNRIDSIRESKKQLDLEDIEEVSREFGVSREAMLWRLKYLYNISADKIKQYLEKTRDIKLPYPERQNDKPDKLPERYCGLAIRALNEGRLSMMQFAKYMEISYKKAQEYLSEDFTDEKISIPIA